MPFQKGKSGNPAGLAPGTRAPTNKQIKNAIKNCSIKAVDNLAAYMNDCREYIDDCWVEYHNLHEKINIEIDDAAKAKLFAEASLLRATIFKCYKDLAEVSQTLLDYSHKHIVNEERVNKTTKASSDDDTKEPEATVSLKAV